MTSIHTALYGWRLDSTFAVCRAPQCMPGAYSHVVGHGRPVTPGQTSTSPPPSGDQRRDVAVVGALAAKLDGEPGDLELELVDQLQAGVDVAAPGSGIARRPSSARPAWPNRSETGQGCPNVISVAWTSTGRSGMLRAVALPPREERAESRRCAPPASPPGGRHWVRSDSIPCPGRPATHPSTASGSGHGMCHSLTPGVVFVCR
jgi:hypothetical protein